MEWINIIVSAVCALLGALGGGSVFYFQQNKRLKAAEAQRAGVIAHNEAENSEVERWRGLADRSEEQLKQASEHIVKKNEQVDNLYKRQHELENDVRVLTNKYNSAMQVIDRIRHYYCTNRPCPHWQEYSARTSYRRAVGAGYAQGRSNTAREYRQPR